MKCKSCGAQLDFTQSACPACGVEVELGRLTGILGVVCRSCDAYNEPGAKVCSGCGRPLGEVPEAGTAPAAPARHVKPEGPTVRPLAPGASAPALAGTITPPTGQPVVRSFLRGSGARSVPASHRDALASSGSRCPRCGAEAPGSFCSRCGQAQAPVGQAAQVDLVPGKARLVLERGAGREGEVYGLDSPVTEVGRTRGAIVFPDDPTLAPHHASFLFQDGVLRLRDEGAQGGIHLRLRGLSIPLRPGDHLVVGDRLLRYAGPLTPPAGPPPDGTHRLGAPRPAGPTVVLEEILEGGAVGRAFARPGPSITIGRTGCAVNLGDDPHLSQAHAELVIDSSGNARLRDLGSANGTYSRLPARGEIELRDADVVRIGREVLRVSLAERAA